MLLYGLTLEKGKRRWSRFNHGRGGFAETWDVYGFVDNSMQILLLNKGLVGYQVTLATGIELNLCVLTAELNKRWNLKKTTFHVSD